MGERERTTEQRVTCHREKERERETGAGRGRDRDDVRRCGHSERLILQW